MADGLQSRRDERRSFRPAPSWRRSRARGPAADWRLRGKTAARSARGSPRRDQLEKMAATAARDEGEIGGSGNRLAGGLPRRADQEKLAGDVGGPQHASKRAMRNQALSGGRLSVIRKVSERLPHHEAAERRSKQEAKREESDVSLSSFAFGTRSDRSPGPRHPEPLPFGTASRLALGTRWGAVTGQISLPGYSAACRTRIRPRNPFLVAPRGQSLVCCRSVRYSSACSHRHAYHDSKIRIRPRFATSNRPLAT